MTKKPKRHLKKEAALWIIKNRGACAGAPGEPECEVCPILGNYSICEAGHFNSPSREREKAAREWLDKQ